MYCILNNKQLIFKNVKIAHFVNEFSLLKCKVKKLKLKVDMVNKQHNKNLVMQNINS